MLVVSDTSPLSNLAMVGLLHLLRLRYAAVAIPPMVRRELDALQHEGARMALGEALEEGWLSVAHLPEATDLAALLERADPGECEAIALARSIRADKILIDDRAARELGREYGLKVAGLLGELLHAKRAGWITSVRGAMDQLQGEARFFIRDDLRRLILSEAFEE